MKVYALLVSLLLAVNALAGSISWDSIQCWSEEAASEHDVFVDGEYFVSGGHYNPALIMTVTPLENDTFHVTTFDYSQTAAGFIGNWNVASKGDVVSADTIRGLGEYFNHCKLDGEMAANVDYNGNMDETFYLMFAVADINSHEDDQVDQNVLYGWLEMNFSNGILELTHSAIGLEGQSMIVGVIPEPATAFLVLIGGVGTFLKRRRRAHRARPTSRGIPGSDPSDWDTGVRPQ